MSFVGRLMNPLRGSRRCTYVGTVILMLACQEDAALWAQDQPSGRSPTAWTLEQVVVAALTQHPLVEAARARLDAAKGERVTAAALPNPVGTYWVENAGFPGQGTLSGISRETSLYATLPLEPFFQRSPRIRRADQDVKAADASLTLARRQVATDAIRAFFRVALEQASVDAAEENRAGLEQLAAYNRARVNEGVTAEAELIRVQVELDRAATEVALAETALARARAELQPYLGETLGVAASTVRAVVPLPQASANGTAASQMPSLDTVMSRARQSRPEVVAGRTRVAAEAATADYERTLSLRQVGASFGLKRTDGQNSMVAGVSVAVPLFDRNRGGVQRAVAERTAAEQELAWTERRITAEVQGAYDSANRLSRQVASLQQSFLARAEEVRRITVGAYQEGGATLLQVLDATRTLAEARLTYSRAVFAQRQSLVDLALASGADPQDALDTSHTWTVASGDATPNGGRQ